MWSFRFDDSRSFKTTRGPSEWFCLPFYSLLFDIFQVVLKVRSKCTWSPRDKQSLSSWSLSKYSTLPDAVKLHGEPAVPPGLQVQRTKCHLSNGIGILRLPPILERILQPLLTAKQIHLQRNQAKAMPTCLLMVPTGVTTTLEGCISQMGLSD